jgi:hypothetical protein
MAWVMTNILKQGVITVFVFLLWPPGGQVKNQTGRKFGLRVILTYKVSGQQLLVGFRRWLPGGHI